MKFTTITLGCKVNIYETEALIDSLCDKGWQYIKNGEYVDVCILILVQLPPHQTKKADK